MVLLCVIVCTLKGPLKPRNCRSGSLCFFHVGDSIEFGDRPLSGSGPCVFLCIVGSEPISGFTCTDMEKCFREGASHSHFKSI